MPKPLNPRQYWREIILVTIIIVSGLLIWKGPYIRQLLSYNLTVGVPETHTNPCDNDTYEQQFSSITAIGNHKWTYLCYPKNWTVKEAQTRSDKSTYIGEQIFITFKNEITKDAPLPQISLTSLDYKKTGDSGVSPWPWESIQKQSSIKTVTEALKKTQIHDVSQKATKRKTQSGTIFFEIEEQGVSAFDNKPFHMVTYFFPKINYNNKQYNMSLHVPDISQKQISERMISHL